MWCRMAEEHGSPLAFVRLTEDGRNAMTRRFKKEKVQTPWVVSEEMYEQMTKIDD